MTGDYNDRIRLDKWLWAARFFKTRSLAKAAIEGGKVQVEGQRAKPSREVTCGMALSVRRGWEQQEIVVDGLSDQRRGAPEAAALYTELPASVERRERERAARKDARSSQTDPEQRPTKRQRRQLDRLRARDLD